MANEVAPEGAVYVCRMCGKRSKDLYGDQAIDLFWDESCILNAVLCKEDSLEFNSMQRVRKADAWVPDEEVQA